jgi:hypothetical protein
MRISTSNRQLDWQPGRCCQRPCTRTATSAPAAHLAICSAVGRCGGSLRANSSLHQELKLSQ